MGQNSTVNSQVSVERISGSIERVTFHSEATGEFIECLGFWNNDRQYLSSACIWGLAIRKVVDFSVLF